MTKGAVESTGSDYCGQKVEHKSLTIVFGGLSWAASSLTQWNIQLHMFSALAFQPTSSNFDPFGFAFVILVLTMVLDSGGLAFLHTSAHTKPTGHKAQGI